MEGRSERDVKRIQLRRLLVNSVMAAVIGSASAALVGCDTKGSGKPTAHLSGVITIDGRPTPSNAWGTINFRATSPGQARDTSASITNGKYDSPDVPAGKIMVNIQIVQPTGKTINDGGRQIPEIRDLIASKYNNGFEMEITGDNPDQNFDLESNQETD
jgi:hypothetical protein